MSVYKCEYRAFIWILLGFTIATGTEEENIIKCYGQDLNPACITESKIAITSFHYGFKSNSLNCPVDGTASGPCCEYDETTDCLQEAPAESRYVDELSGKNAGVISTSAPGPTPGGACDNNTAYSVTSVFSELQFQCIKGSEIVEMCKDVRMTNASIVYLNNINYPDGIPNTMKNCTCSVQTQISRTLQMQTLHIDLDCDQSLSIIDIVGNVLKNFSCKTLSVNKITNETFETSYIILNLKNLYTTTNAGKFWFGFLATADIRPGPSVSLHCPAVYPDCGPPPNISDGSVNYTGTAYGSSATYTCNEGYTFTLGNGSLLCGLGDSWEGTVPYCSRINCSEPKDIDNGNVTYTSTVYGNTVTYVCHRGHNMTDGNPTRICLADGKWNGTAPTCSPVDCGVPPNVSDTNVNYTGTMFGSNATYTCRDGYNLTSSNDILLCGEDGFWEGTIPTCSRINCSEPEDIENGNVTYSSLTFGSSVTYVCKEGHMMIDGNPTRTCSADGTWNGTEPICSPIYCSMPDDIQNGRVTLSSTVNGLVATYVCDEGHVMTDGNQKRICPTNGGWDGIAPTCSPVDGFDLLTIILIAVGCVVGTMFVVGIGICVCRRRHPERSSVPWQKRRSVNQDMKIPRASTHNSSDSSSSCSGADRMEICDINSRYSSGFHPDLRRSSKSWDLLS